LEKGIVDHKERQGYDMERHYNNAFWSSGSQIILELWLFIVLWLISGAMYLDMIFLAFQTISEIDEALDNIMFHLDSIEKM
jgi:hypothetical protein